MASISKLANGYKKIQFVVPGSGGKRRSIRLGKCSLRMAESVKLLVEHLVAASLTGHALDPETARKVSELSDELADKLAAVGLIRRRKRSSLSGFLKSYIDGRANLKPNTLRNYRVTEQHLLGHFGSDKALTDITPGDADLWREGLLGKGLNAATVGREVKRAKQFFRAAARQ